MNFLKNLKRVALAALSALTLGLFSVQASATTVDVSSIVTDITAVLASVVLVATAVVGIFLALKGFKWVRRAMS